MSASSPTQRQELAYRSSGGIDVALYWSAEGNRTTIEIWHAATDELIAFAVAPERALDAYYHPFAHIPMGNGALISVPQT